MDNPPIRFFVVSNIPWDADEDEAPSCFVIGTPYCFGLYYSQQLENNKEGLSVLGYTKLEHFIAGNEQFDECYAIKVQFEGEPEALKRHSLEVRTAAAMAAIRERLHDR